nr:RHS repeat-associated core domain-containing protein [Aphanothece hegewaldii]
MGTTIGLANGTGTEVADFRYDSFGNLRVSSGIAAHTGNAGGDFGFQGQWLESESGLYYFRARDYDSKTGLFLSRDPVDIIETEPESFNPYQFVYNNPLVYSDPTGMFTLVELQAGYVTEKALNSIQLKATNYARQYLIDKAKGVATDIITGVAQNILGNLAQLNPLLANSLNVVLSQKGKNKLGEQWEILLKGQFKDFIGNFFPEYLGSVWFEPEVSINGEPKSNGINFVQLSINTGNPNLPNPDFIIKMDGGPESTDFAKGKGKKSNLIGDFKFSWERVEGDLGKAQFSAMMSYARYSSRHQVVPIALYVTMIGGESTLSLHKVTKKAIQEHAVYPQFLTLFPNIKGLKK